MIKWVSSNEKLYGILANSALFKYFICYKIDRIKDIQNESLYEKAYSNIITSNSTLKTTRAGRFKELDEWFSDYLKSVDSIHDVAVSNGITTLELYKLLLNSGKSVEMFYSDKFGKCTLVKNLLSTYIFDANGKLMHVYLGCIYIDNKVSSLFFISKLLYYFFPREIKNSKKQKSVSLFHKKVLENSGRLKEIDYDIFNTTLPNKFNAVRAMNILNKAYFKETEILIAIKNLILSITEGGLLLIGRTQNTINHAGLYKKTSGKFVLIDSFNEGSEIHYLIEKFNNA